MEKSKGQKDLDEYVLTRSEMAKEIGISTNALKCRMRKGNTDGLEFRHDGEKFLFKRLRGNQDGQTPVVRPKGRWHEGNKKKKKDWSKVRRGTTHIGEANYPNEPFRKHNELKILNRIQKNVPQYVLDKINPRLLNMANQEYQNELLGKTNEAKFTRPKYYGGMLNEGGRRLEKDYRFNFNRESADTSFRPSGQPRDNQRSNPYEITSPVDDGSVEINERDFPRDDTEPRFKDKIDESIYRAKKYLKG